MPKRLSDITHEYESTARHLEHAQDRLTEVTEAAQAQVNTASEAHRKAHTDLYAYLRAHPDSAVVAGDTIYTWERGEIRCKTFVWSHDTWVDDPPPPAQRGTPGPWNDPNISQDPLPAMATAWGTIQPRSADGDGNWLEPRAGEAEFGDTEPNGQPLTVCED